MSASKWNPNMFVWAAGQSITVNKTGFLKHGYFIFFAQSKSVASKNEPVRGIGV